MILVDIHFQRPALHSLAPCPNDLGLSSLLAGHLLDPAPALRPFPSLPSLRLLPVGPAPFPFLTLSVLRRLRALVGLLLRRTEYLVVDAPVLRSVRGHRLLAAIPVPPLLVLRAAPALDQPASLAAATRLLSRPPLGAILNALDLTNDAWWAYYVHYHGLA